MYSCVSVRTPLAGCRKQDSGHRSVVKGKRFFEYVILCRLLKENYVQWS
jgi:hypothetical protein